MELTQARQLALDLAPERGMETIRLEDALGRVLAEAVTAPVDVPGEARSRLDGYALRSEDLLHAEPERPVGLLVAPGLVAAGCAEERTVQWGECIRILTGAMMPRGADAVAAQESVGVEGGRIWMGKALPAGSGVGLPGGDVRRGELVLAAGEVLTPTRLAMIAAFGRLEVCVFRQPVVALLATGDEVRELGGAAEGPFTFCNNRHLLAWLIRLHGAKPVHVGVAPDDPVAIADRLRDVSSDLVVTTGGIGQGDKDFILAVWQRLGVNACFREINLSPGKNSAMGTKDGRMFWALPGNPWGAQVVYEELVAPVLLRSQGMKDVRRPVVTARLETTLTKKSGTCRAVRGTLRKDPESALPVFAPGIGKSQSLFASLKDSFVYILLDAHVVEVAAGSNVEVRLHDFPVLASPMLTMNEK